MRKSSCNEKTVFNAHILNTAAYICNFNLLGYANKKPLYVVSVSLKDSYYRYKCQSERRKENERVFAEMHRKTGIHRRAP